MKLLTFSSRREYWRAQRRKQLSSISRGPFLDEREVKIGAEWLRGRTEVQYALCHGARDGSEVLYWRDQFPGARIFGTDLFPRASEDLVIRLDFHRFVRRWRRRLDFIYSNSLDHSPNPSGCLKTWFGELRPTGFLLLQWGSSHGEECARGADCFGASVGEYLKLLAVDGEVEDVLMCPAKRRQRTLLLISKPKLETRE